MLARIAASLTRVTSSGRVIGEIDGLRFIAIAVVILHHILHVLGDQPNLNRGVLAQFVVRFFELGNVGVQLFFGISGFILALPFAEACLAGGRPIALKRYYLRRLNRLEPPYIVNLLALTLLALWLHGSARIARIPHFLASLTYTHNFIYDRWSEINFVAWSLELEAQFYVLAPLLALVFRIRSSLLRRSVVGCAMAACAILATRFPHVAYGIRMMIVFHLHYFLVGFLLADLYATRRWGQATDGTAGADLMATLAITVLFFMRSNEWMKEVSCLAIFVFYTGVLRGRLWRKALSFSPIAIYGGMCYTIYLYHFWIMRPFVHAIGGRVCSALPYGFGLLLLGAATLSFVGVVASVPFVLFEKPFMYPMWPQWVAQRVSSVWHRK